MSNTGYRLLIKYKGKDYVVELPQTGTFGALKQRLFELTNVEPQDQKLMGFGNSKSSANDDVFSSC